MPSRTVNAPHTSGPVASQEPSATSAPACKFEENMAAESNETRRNVTVQLQYLQNDPLYSIVKPVQVTPNFLDHEGQSNVRLEVGPPEVINDVRGLQHSFTLDGNGFCYVYAPTNFKDWSSQPQIAKEYLPEMEKLLKREIEGCDEIIFYDARIRQEGDEGARVQGLSYNPFARQVHVDNTETSVLEKIHNITDMKADYYLPNGRARIINIWRPIKHPVYDCGLAVADGGKLQKGDIIECNRIRQDTGQYWDTMGVVKYRSGYDWYYMSQQDEPDVLLFKNYDSATDVPARNCLHTAFDLPPSGVTPGEPTRESIEVRALIFTHPKGFHKPSGEAMPHPLALQLEQGNLKMVDEEHSITDHLRTDIDEASEIKDAMLMLRKQEIRRLESQREALTTECDEIKHERDQLRDELEQAQEQIVVRTNHAETMLCKLRRLQSMLAPGQGHLHDQIGHLSRQVADARLYEQTRGSTDSDSVASDASTMQSTQDDEITLLKQHVEGLKAEAQKWKAEAMGRASKAVSRVWQGSVDEAVRREKEKDSLVIKALTAEIQKLRAGQESVGGT